MRGIFVIAISLFVAINSLSAYSGPTKLIPEPVEFSTGEGVYTLKPDGSDIKVYMNFETLRLSFYKLNEACELAKKKQTFDHMLDYVYDYYNNLQSAKPKEELRRIISN